MSGWDRAAVTATIVGVVAGVFLALWGTPLYSIPAFLIALIGVTQLVEPLKKIFKREEPPATQAGQEQILQEVRQFREQLPKNPPIEEVRSEVEREIAGELRAKGQEVLSLYREGNRLYEASRYAEAAEKFRAALKVVDAPSIRLTLGNSLLTLGKLDEAYGEYTASLKKYRDIGNRLGEAKTLGGVGIAHLLLHREPEEALKLLEAALKLNREIGDSPGKASNLLNIGIIHFIQGKQAEALQSYEAALKIYREIGDQLGVASSMSSIAFIYGQRGKWREALKFHEEAEQIFRKNGARRESEIAQREIANIKRKMKKKDDGQRDKPN
ncbi:MAG: tetratricopeptide repeat protein [Candidatus Tectomicrobia bacterium]|nr:tetratricopeptide repeat protein [Candidatus Tectomicrobia bacterium]